jgi:hypothetical protein
VTTNKSAVRVPRFESMLACGQCVAARMIPIVHVGLTRDGIRIDCERHGLMAHLTPRELAEQMRARSVCECCGEPIDAPTGTHGGHGAN